MQALFAAAAPNQVGAKYQIASISSKECRGGQLDPKTAVLFHPHFCVFGRLHGSHVEKRSSPSTQTKVSWGPREVPRVSRVPRVLGENHVDASEFLSQALVS